MRACVRACVCVRAFACVRVRVHTHVRGGGGGGETSKGGGGASPEEAIVDVYTLWVLLPQMGHMSSERLFERSVCVCVCVF